MVSTRQAVAAILLSSARRASVSHGPAARASSAAGLLCALTASLTWAPHVLAQEAPTASSTSEQPTTLEEVTVTGSRIKRTTDFNTPTPTTVIDTTAMENLGLVNVGQAALLSPANVSTFTPANTGNSNFFTGSYIPDLRGLNPYFGSRTLLLIDGQRAVNSNQGDSFDLNLIPQILVSRIDTVTGGASAAYGSGAIAGVENIILDNKLEGGKLVGDFDQTSHSDGRDRHVGAAFGHGLFDNRFHFLIGGEYENSAAVGCEDARSWCAENQGEYQLGSTAPASGSAGILGFEPTCAPISPPPTARCSHLDPSAASPAGRSATGGTHARWHGHAALRVWHAAGVIRRHRSGSVREIRSISTRTCRRR